MITPASIRLTWRQVIDVRCTGSFAPQVFNDSYEEFLIQAQAYNPGNQFRYFSEMVAHNPKAGSLNYKVGFAIGLYLQELNHQIPELTDLMGQKRLRFSGYVFQLIESDITNRGAHKIAILYHTEPLTCYGIAGDQLILSDEHWSNEGWKDTFGMKLNDNLVVSAWTAVKQGIEV